MFSSTDEYSWWFCHIISNFTFYFIYIFFCRFLILLDCNDLKYNLSKFIYFYNWCNSITLR